jgi:hypothetical protein
MARETLHPSDIRLLEQFQSALKIDKHNLDEALLQQPDIFYRVSEGFAYAISLRDRAKSKLAEVSAEQSLVERRKAKQDDEKITEDGLKARIALNDKVQDAQQDYHASALVADRWQGMKESWQQRSYVLKDMVGLYSAGYYSDKVSDTTKRGVADARYEDNRKALADARKGNS